MDSCNPVVTQTALGISSGPRNKTRSHESGKETGRDEGGVVRNGKEIKGEKVGEKVIRMHYTQVGKYQ